MRINYFDENLASYSGHGFDYIKNLCECKYGEAHKFTAFINKKSTLEIPNCKTLKLFTVKTADNDIIFREYDKNLFKKLIIGIYTNTKFLIEYFKIIKYIENSDINIMGSINRKYSFAFNIILLYLSLRGKKCNFIFILHDKIGGIEYSILQSFKKWGYSQKIYPAGQSLAISSEYFEAYNEQIPTLPTPCVPKYKEIDKYSKATNVISYLGLGSSAKGLIFLLESLMKDEIINRDTLNIRIQINVIEPDILSRVNYLVNIMKAKFKYIDFIIGPLSTDEFDSEINIADALILPYDPVKYQYIQSGISTLGIFNGKVIICSSNTSIHKDAISNGSVIALDYGDTDSLINGINEFTCNSNAFLVEAKIKSKKYAELHGPDQYLKIISNIVNKFQETKCMN